MRPANSIWSRLAILLSAMLALAFTQSARADDARAKQLLESHIKAVQDAVTKYDQWESLFPPGTRILEVKSADGRVALAFNMSLGFRLWTAESKAELETALRKAAEGEISADAPLDITLRYDAGRGAESSYPFDDHIISPERIRALSAERSIPRPALAAPVIERLDYAGPERTGGLGGKHLVMGPSHGWTWHKENRWQWQRARVYTIVEDLFPQSYVNPFLIPMLENAGGTVWSVRERDYQTAEVIVDNDGTTELSALETAGKWFDSPVRGWRGGRPAMLDQKTLPFTLGTTLRAEVCAVDDPSSATAVYTPYIPRAGRYGVYASWAMAADNSPSVPVTVRHLAGETRFRVNQQTAGNTWVWLGAFEFAQGADVEKGSVLVQAGGATVSSSAMSAGNPSYVTIDAIRFGGGMGNIAPADMISGKPRYAEGSNTFLQYAGAPAAEVYDRPATPGHFGGDYNKDITARSEWANYLHGSPNGPNPTGRGDARNHPGLGIPVDMFLAWHTDAGFDEKGLIGTLSLWRLFDDSGNERFPDGRSRMLNRDLTGLMHAEIIRTARAQYSSTWVVRALQQRNLGEIRRPNVPSALLEVISHHNFNDMKYGNDPRFKRDMARAVYKAILRFLCAADGTEPIVQPLAPSHLSAMAGADGSVALAWRAVDDPLEPTAKPTSYIVYTSRDGVSFDNGRAAESATFRAEGIPSGETRYFRVTAANAGGESLPSRLVGARAVAGKEPILIVDGFDRISGPAIVHEERAHGFDRKLDPGVGYNYNYGLVGDQYDFDPKSAWVNDLESPGMGASLHDHEDRLELGNMFNHIAAHGDALDPKVPFDSMTADAFAAGAPTTHRVIDWIAGRQRVVMPYRGAVDNGAPDRMRPEFQVLTEPMRDRLRKHVAAGGRLLISGAHIVEDLSSSQVADEASSDFAREVLGVGFYKDRATSTNGAMAAEAGKGPFAEVDTFRFGRDLESPINILASVYPVVSAESFVPSTEGFLPALVYTDTGLSASVASDAVILIGFPIETVLPLKSRDALLDAAIKHLSR